MLTLNCAAVGLGPRLGRGDLLVRASASPPTGDRHVKFSEKGATVRLLHEVAHDSLRVIIESCGKTIPDSAIAKFFDIFSICEAISPGEDLGLSAPVATASAPLFGGTLRPVANREPSGIRLTLGFERHAFEVAAQDVPLEVLLKDRSGQNAAGVVYLAV